MKTSTKLPFHYLLLQVVRCKDGADAPWFDEDADAVVQFLNKKYYRF